MEKPWYQSKTVWSSIIGGAVAISTAFGFDLGLDPDQQTAIVGGIMAVIGIVLRFVTKEPLRGRE